MACAVIPLQAADTTVRPYPIGPGPKPLPSHSKGHCLPTHKRGNRQRGGPWDARPVRDPLHRLACIISPFVLEGKLGTFPLSLEDSQSCSHRRYRCRQGTSNARCVARGVTLSAWTCASSVAGGPGRLAWSVWPTVPTLPLSPAGLSASPAVCPAEFRFAPVIARTGVAVALHGDRRA